ncbi:restriction endonuclease subunit S [Streptomyces naphthomycinicus]|uniref:restriction endonuclease subunit S n=1 Tax=Streptomyces naphthomycinicus TaxID=2872625 RepID=UPI001CEC14C5|nr:restriction endonuclease subunit S [Streptomyces sp. TML10]
MSVDGERDLPAGWTRATLKDVARWGSGGTPKAKEPSYYGGPIPWAVIGDLTDSVLVRTAQTITEAGLASSSAKWVPENSVLVAMYGASIGKLALPLAPVTTNQAMAFAVPHPEIMDRKYLFWYLRSQRAALVRAGKGGAQPNISQTVLKGWPIPVPPLSEQRRIVEAIEETLSRLDKATALVRSADARTGALVARRVDDLVLGEGWPARPPLTGESLRELGPSKTRRFAYETLPQLPPAWRWRRAEEVCASVFCGSTPAPHLMHSGAGDIPFLKVYNIRKQGGIDFSVNPTFVDAGTHEGVLRRSRVVPGDVLTNIVGPPLGKTALVPDRHPEWNINQAIVAFRAGDPVTPEWLALVLRAPRILGMLRATAKATAGQFNIALSTCRDLPVPVPPRAEQREIAERAQTFLDGIERVRPAAASIRARADALQRAVLRKAFRGTLVPRHACAPTSAPAPAAQQESHP